MAAKKKRVQEPEVLPDFDFLDFYQKNCALLVNMSLKYEGIEEGA